MGVLFMPLGGFFVLFNVRIRKIPAPNFFPSHRTLFSRLFNDLAPNKHL